MCFVTAGAKCVVKPVNENVAIHPCTFGGIIRDRQDGLVNILKAPWVGRLTEKHQWELV